jgi:nicotinamide-nucleotide amidase
MTEWVEIDADLLARAAALLAAARACGETVATAESCTGGLLAAALTAIPGSSEMFERGFVTYSNSAKSEMLGVPFWLIERHGAVSEDVARAMAGGVLTHSHASLAVAVTGIAGPDGGTPEKPVGLVYFAAGRRDEPMRSECVLFGDLGRAEIRRRSVERALSLLLSLL